jgi:hypothetical protein
VVLAATEEQDGTVSIALPAPVQGHTGASNGFDGDALSGWLADDFLGNDNWGEFWEEKAARSWLHPQDQRRQVAADPGFTTGHYGLLNAGAVSDAQYDPTRLPDPLALTCCFTARDGRVVRLIIIHNEAALAWAPQ